MLYCHSLDPPSFHLFWTGKGDVCEQRHCEHEHLHTAGPFREHKCEHVHSEQGVSENSVPLNPMVLLIIIPMKNGYFIGNIPNIFRQTQQNLTLCGALQDLQLVVDFMDFEDLDMAHGLSKDLDIAGWKSMDKGEI